MNILRLKRVLIHLREKETLEHRKEIQKIPSPNRNDPLSKQYFDCLRLLKDGTLRQKCGAVFTVTSFAEKYDVETAVEAVSDMLVSLLDSPQVDELYWRKTIEFGVRRYSLLVATFTNTNPTSEIANRFRSIIRRILGVADEEIVGLTLTAIYLDAPLLSFPLLEDIRVLRNANPPHISRLGFLFDHCEATLSSLKE